ncbi:MAG: bifunctional hydroxymethylpyrimidine kinase/phosphomethylpyrimidine kinase [Gemmatimonadota bacterium]|nr:bifunctional hydroxymethylpyrimidine kinase/phosphomethylpyrimidine kinase [Gemmatimonadota bacterium]
MTERGDQEGGSARGRIPIALTIAGSDSGGGAGIQADLKTFHQFGVFGTSAVTAVTAQNTTGVQAIHPIPSAVVRAQLESVVTDLRPDALKTGMLATAELVRTVAESIRAHGLGNYVMDPVMVATSGDRLLEREAESALAEALLPLTTVVTPNLEEAALLTGSSVETMDGMRRAARALVDRGAGSALVKGGHLDGDAVDVFWDGSDEHVFRRRRVATKHTHGTGCTLSAAIAANLARGLGLAESVARATRFVGNAIATAPGLGSGRGPVNHFASTE